MESFSRCLPPALDSRIWQCSRAREVHLLSLDSESSLFLLNSAGGSVGSANPLLCCTITAFLLGHTLNISHHFLPGWPCRQSQAGTMFCTKYSSWYFGNLVAERLLVHFFTHVCFTEVALDLQLDQQNQNQTLAAHFCGSRTGPHVLLCSLYISVPSLSALIHRVPFNLVHAALQTGSHSSRITILRRAFQFEKFMKRVTLLLTFNDTCGIGKRRVNEMELPGCFKMYVLLYSRWQIAS